jgi:hypothetical protein
VTDEQQPPEPEKPKTGLVQQAHGGAINRGNMRPADPTPSEVRQLARKRFYQVIPQLNRIARNRNRKTKNGQPKRSFRVADQIRAAALLAQQGMSESVNLSDVREALRGTRQAIIDTCPPELASVLIERIAPYWLRVW